MRSGCKETLKAGLDYNMEVHWSSILGEWSNTIDYNMGSSPPGVQTMTKTSPMKTFKHG